MAPKSIQLTAEVLRRVSEYRRLLRGARIPVSHMLVFGSQAKGTARSDSDIDVAIISSKFGINYHRERVKLMKLRGTTLLEIEPHPLHPDDLNDRWSTFAHEVKKYGIPV